MPLVQCEKPHPTSRQHGQPRKIPQFLGGLDNDTRRANITASAARKFDPVDWNYPSTWNSNDLVTQPQGSDFTWLSCPFSEICPVCNQRVHHKDCLVVAVDGACSGNGRKDSIVKAGVGVYFRDNSRYNIQMRLDDVPGQQTTSQQAELMAVILALMQLKTAKTNPNFAELDDLSYVIIKSDSIYVVQGMTEWIGKWTQNNFRTDKGTPVANAPLFRLLSKVVNLLQLDFGIKIYFWHVLREFNRDADWLAKQSLKSYSTDVSDMDVSD